MGDRIGIGIIGCGRWGQNLIRVFNQLPEAKMVICCNKSNSDRLDQLRALYPEIETTQDVEYILANSMVDAILVATPDQTHFDISKNALEAGKHVFVEKPMAMSFAQAKYLVDLAKSKYKILMPGHIMQYHPAIRWIKKRLMANPTNIVSILSTRIEFGTAKVDSDLLWSTVVHDVSIVQYLLGNEPRKICAVGASLNEEKLKDIIFINLIFPSNVIGHISAGFAGPYRDRRLVLHTTQETIVFDGLNGNLELFTRKTSEANAAYGIREYEKQFGAGQKIELNKEEPLKVEGQHFIDCIKMNQAPQSGGENALAVMRTLDKIEKTLN